MIRRADGSQFDVCADGVLAAASDTLATDIAKVLAPSGEVELSPSLDEVSSDDFVEWLEHELDALDGSERRSGPQLESLMSSGCHEELLRELRAKPNGGAADSTELHDSSWWRSLHRVCCRWAAVQKVWLMVGGWWLVVGGGGGGVVVQAAP